MIVKLYNNIIINELSLDLLSTPPTDAHIIKWSPEGDKYAVVVNDRVDIYDLETASVTGTITNPKRISSIKFLNVSSHSQLL